MIAKVMPLNLAMESCTALPKTIYGNFSCSDAVLEVERHCAISTGDSEGTQGLPASDSTGTVERKAKTPYVTSVLVIPK